MCFWFSPSMGTLVGRLVGRQITNQLSDMECRRKRHSGTTRAAERHADGNGLYLTVTPSGTKHWTQRLYIKGRRRSFGLGAYPLVPLGEARKLAAENRKVAREGGDPLEVRRKQAERRKKQDEIPNFRDAAEAVIELRAAGWRPGGKSAAQWRTTLATYAYPILGDRKVSEITSSQCLKVIAPIYSTKPETAARVRQRISAVMRWAIVQGYRKYNPADPILEALPSDKRRVVQHFRALPYEEVPAAIVRIRSTRAWIGTKLALEFLILTATRSGEVRGAMWDEIDLDERLWTIPGDRMKANKPHRVPLSNRCMAILAEAAQIPSMLAHLANNPLVFPSIRGRPASDNTLSKLLRDNKIGAVPHGFRSSFRDWSAEQTNAPRAVMEAALAHVIQNRTERAYARSDLFEKRRLLLERWAAFVGQERGEVVSIAAGDMA